jgi:hypothetical protein
MRRFDVILNGSKVCCLAAYTLNGAKEIGKLIFGRKVEVCYH